MSEANAPSLSDPNEDHARFKRITKQVCCITMLIGVYVGFIILSLRLFFSGVLNLSSLLGLYVNVALLQILLLVCNELKYTARLYIHESGERIQISNPMLGTSQETEGTSCRMENLREIERSMTSIQLEDINAPSCSFHGTNV